MNALSVCDDRYIKTKIATYGGKVYTNFRGLNVAEDDVECELFVSWCRSFWVWRRLIFWFW